MHEVRLNPDIVARVMKRRGSLNAFSTLDPRRTALLCIDTQNWMIDPNFETAIKSGADVVKPINRVASALRDRGGTVVWVKQVTNDQAIPEWSVLYDAIFANQRSLLINAMQSGGDIYPGMDVKSADLISEKTRYSCVLDQSSDLHQRLRDRGIDTVIVGGIATNVCCESSARDAMMLNYRTIVLSDGCAAHTDAEHNASLSNLLYMFADIRTSEEVVDMLSASPKEEA